MNHQNQYTPNSHVKSNTHKSGCKNSYSGSYFPLFPLIIFVFIFMRWNTSIFVFLLLFFLFSRRGKSHRRKKYYNSNTYDDNSKSFGSSEEENIPKNFGNKKFCSNCGTKLDYDSIFCSNCGLNLK